MIAKTPATELTSRMDRFRARMTAVHPDWRLAAFLGRVNQFYFTGTMQDGVVLVPRDHPAVFWVRRSLERAQDESMFADLRPMRSYRDAAQALGASAPWPVIHLETELVPFAWVQRFRKYFPCADIASLDSEIAAVRAIKSPYELAAMEQAGTIHRRILEEGVPTLLREGMSEAEFAADLFALMVREGHEGTVRFHRFNVEVSFGQIGFGENSLYPTSFDGPGGCRGIGAASPVLGSPHRRLRPGDLVFVDIGCSVLGYSTDKTMIYMFGEPLPDGAIAAHRQCVELQRQLAARLRPGTIPSALYAETMSRLDPQFLEHFMGFGNRRASFLGHGVGLQIDEVPVIAEGFDDPLAEGMVLALEPKKGVPGVGMVGTENTYVVTPEGGRSLTGELPGPILVRRDNRTQVTARVRQPMRR